MSNVIPFPTRPRLPQSMEQHMHYWPSETREGEPPKPVQAAWDAVAALNEMGLRLGLLDTDDFKAVHKYVHGHFEEVFVAWGKPDHGGAA